MRNDEELNQRIAEACGWTEIEREDFSEFGVTCFIDMGRDPLSGERFNLPDYCNDLNAMHEAEKTLKGNDVYEYFDMLTEICAEQSHLCMGGFVAHATARQRAEAFYRTLNPES